MPPAQRLLGLLLHWRRRHKNILGGATPWDSSGGENNSRPGLRCCEPSGFRGDAWVCEFQTPHHSVNACAVSPRSFGGAAGLSVFQLWVQEGTASATLSATHPDSVAESFLHVGDVVVQRQDTPSARVQVIKPLVGDVRVAQIFISRNLLPSSFGEECAP